MCGIIGYLGHQQSLPILLEGLKRLEYRGYDSAGLAVVNDHGLQVRKAAGRISVLEGKVSGERDTLLSGEPELLGCLDQLRCQEQLAQQTAAQFALRLSIGAPGLPSDKGPQKGTSFQFSGEMLDVDVGVVSVRASQTCGDCNLKRAMQMLYPCYQLN